jgi:hypothetical protein
MHTQSRHRCEIFLGAVSWSDYSTSRCDSLFLFIQSTEHWNIAIYKYFIKLLRYFGKSIFITKICVLQVKVTCNVQDRFLLCKTLKMLKSNVREFVAQIKIMHNAYERIPVQKSEIDGHGDSLRWPRDTLYPLKLALRRQAEVAGSV